MRVFHRTRGEFAESILAEGFRDATGCWMTDYEHTGVWVADVPFACMHNDTDKLLVLEIREDIFEEYEWVQEGSDYREALIPAAILNQFGPPSVVDESEEEV